MVTTCELITEQMGLLFKCSTVDSYIRIETPFLYPDGDVIDIFYKMNEDAITLTDLGETLRWLRMQTVTQKRTTKQRQLIADVCLNHNIRLERGMLTSQVTSPENLTDAVIKLSQGILRVSDLWFTFRNAAGESIIGEFYYLFQERQIRF